ncbi:hypothetical protein PSR1_03843 [Anaeromyxobacter sp. PSR-1]|nr:hypothetical protein PSR1_03843 [Anaeromyxobacter sp. PSR-1]
MAASAFAHSRRPARNTAAFTMASFAFFSSYTAGGPAGASAAAAAAALPRALPLAFAAGGGSRRLAARQAWK